MKKTISFLLIIYCAFIIFNYSNVIVLTQNVLINFINTLIPSLFPLMFLLNILLDSNVLIILLNKNVLLKEILLIAITIVLGLPSNVIFLNKMEKDNLISKEKKNNLINCFGTFSFSFLWYFLVLNNNKGYLYLLIIFFSELLIYFFFYKKENEERINYRLKLNKQVINSSLNKTTFTLLFIFVSTLFINLLFSFDLNYYNTTSPIIMMVEFSYAAKFVKDSSFIFKDYFLLFICCYTSISSYLQIYYFDKNFSLYEQIKKRTYIALFSLSLLILLL